MVKEGHRHRTTVIPVELDERLIRYIQRVNNSERERKIPRRAQTDGSSVIAAALEAYLEKHNG